MQPKNSLKASAVKPAQAKISITSIIGSGTNLCLNNQKVFKYNSGPTGNCQISSIGIVEGELFLQYLRDIEEKHGLDQIKKMFGFHKSDLKKGKYITLWTFRTKFLPEKYLELLIGDNESLLYFKEDYFINREKYTKLFLKN